MHVWMQMPIPFLCLAPFSSTHRICVSELGKPAKNIPVYCIISSLLQFFRLLLIKPPLDSFTGIPSHRSQKDNIKSDGCQTI